MKLEEIRAIMEADKANPPGMLICHGDPTSRFMAMSRTVLPKLLKVAEAAHFYLVHGTAPNYAALDAALVDLEATE